MPYTDTTRNFAGRKEVLVFEDTRANSTANSGVVSLAWNLPPGAYYVGACVSTSSAGIGVTGQLRLYVYQTPAQDTAAAALSAPINMTRHGAITTAVTFIEAPAASTYAGSSAMVSLGTAYAMAPICAPYGLRIHTTCNTNSGSRTVKVVAQQV